MNPSALTFPLVAVAALAATALSLPVAAEDCARPAASVAAPVADDPDQPLDPRDPQFAEKSAQRYQLMLRSAPARRAEPTR
jgi:hypothetical protein